MRLSDPRNDSRQAELQGPLDSLRADRTERDRQLAADTTLIMVELVKPRPSSIFERGDYRRTGQPVEPAVRRLEVRHRLAQAGGEAFPGVEHGLPVVRVVGAQQVEFPLAPGRDGPDLAHRRVELRQGGGSIHLLGERALASRGFPFGRELFLIVGLVDADTYGPNATRPLNRGPPTVYSNRVR